MEEVLRLGYKLADSEKLNRVYIKKDRTREEIEIFVSVEGKKLKDEPETIGSFPPNACGTGENSKLRSLLRIIYSCRCSSGINKELEFKG